MASAPPLLPHLNFDPTEIARIQVAAAANRRAGASDAMQTELGYARLAADQQQAAAALAAREQENRLKLDLEREQGAQLMAYRQQQNELDRTRYLEALRIRQAQEERQAAAAAARMGGMMKLKAAIAKGMPPHIALASIPELFEGTGAPGPGIMRGAPRPQAEFGLTPPELGMPQKRIVRQPDGRITVISEGSQGSLRPPREYIDDAAKMKMRDLIANEQRLRGSLTGITREQAKRRPEWVELYKELDATVTEKEKVRTEAEKAMKARTEEFRRSRGGGGAGGAVLMKLPDGSFRPVDLDKVDAFKAKYPGSEVLGPMGIGGGGAGFDAGTDFDDEDALDADADAWDEGM